MATIDVATGASWTTFHVSGDVHRDDMLAAINNHYKQLTHLNVIWDFSTASVIRMSRADFEAVAAASRANSQGRNSSKTAFVGNTPETFAQACIYTSVALMADVSVDYSAFCTLEEAERWIA